MSTAPRSLRWSSCLLALAATLGISTCLLADQSGEQQTPPLDKKLEELIARLGDDSFATRERAQSELERFGVVAFDALYNAQFNDDIEIAMRARQLVRRMRINWSTEHDSAEVKRILRNYGEQTEVERRNRMDRLAKLDDNAGIEALCRLMRFESSPVLSKQAALLVLLHAEVNAGDEEQRLQLSESISQIVGLSERTGATWLKTYVTSLETPATTISTWEELTNAELKTFAKFPDKTRREIVRDLLRWQVDLLRSQGKQEASEIVMQRSVELVRETREEIMDAVDWLMEREAWVAVDKLATRFSESFEKDALLLYRWAESFVQQGNRERAEELAEKALALTPDEMIEHVVTAYSLQDRGLLEWAEREYRHVMDVGPIGGLADIRARLLLSEMLHDLQKELDAAKVLQGAVDAMEKDPAVLDTVQNKVGRDPGSIHSRMQYFYARHHQQQNDWQKVQERLDEGIRQDPTDADVLIAMYRVESPSEEWKEKTRRRVDSATGHFRDQVREYTQQVAQAPSEPIRAWAERQLASANNQLAWLVANTYGDFDEAIRASHKSLEIRPDTGGYLDTLGRCYFAKGDLENAIKYQSKAVETDPHSEQIRRQLKLFQDELTKQQSKQNEDK